MDNQNCRPAGHCQADPRSRAVSKIVDVLLAEEPTLRFRFGRDELEQRARNFMETLKPDPTWGHGGDQ